MSAAAAVLAVDDNATIRKAISMRLGAKGFDVVTAQDGPQALALIEQQPFDVVILDLQMPGMRGEEVLRRLRQRFSATQLPVIVLAASSDKADINRTLELGANDYIIKPGDLPILIARIRTQIALRDSVARLREQSALMRDVLARHPVQSNTRVALHPAQTDAFVHHIDHAYSIPFDVLHDHTPMTCFTLNSEGSVLYTNRFGAQYLGYRAADLIDRPMLDLYVADDRHLAQENLVNAADLPGRVYRWDIRHVKKDGDIIWMRNTARAVRHGAAVMILVTCEDIDDAYKLSELLSFQSQHDDLTGLANRKTLEQRLNQVIDSAHAEHTEHALAIVDVDQFKLVNDSCGHEAGDELLRQIARLLKGVVRRRDTIARVGGDEFAVLIEDCPMAAAPATAENLRCAVAAHEFVWQERRYPISASVGIVTINALCDSAGSALSMADTACYAAKDSGRNRIHAYEADNLPVALHHGEMRWASRINRALLEDRFELGCQRIMALAADADGSAHYEILLRMRDELGEVIMPGQFLPAAERYNLAARLDRWVIARVFAWMRERPQDLGKLGLCCINLSGQSIGNEEVRTFILAHLADAPVPPHKICFEITETAAISDLVQATRFMHQLKERGVRFALDDFGSGFSSLAYLKQLPVDFLKIDGSFVRDMANDSIDFAMVRSINDIGHVMGKQTIAEFVEDTRTLELLRELGVDYAQGYAIHRPSPLELLKL